MVSKRFERATCGVRRVVAVQRVRLPTVAHGQSVTHSVELRLSSAAVSHPPAPTRPHPGVRTISSLLLASAPLLHAADPPPACGIRLVTSTSLLAALLGSEVAVEVVVERALVLGHLLGARRLRRVLARPVRV